MKSQYSGMKNYLIPFIISTFLYFGILFSVAYYVYGHQNLIKKYTSKKNDFLEITLLQKKKDTPSLKPQEANRQIEKTIQKETQKNTKKEILQAKSKNENTALKELFGKVKTENLPKPKEIPKNSKDSSQASRLKQKASKKQVKKATALTKSLNLKTITTANSSSTGEYDKFLGEVQEILDGYWAQTVDTVAGASAKVKIDIDADGHFSYTIVNLSYNEAFNIKLKQFLTLMKDVQFPKNKDNKTFGTILFKDEMELR